MAIKVRTVMRTVLEMIVLVVKQIQLLTHWLEILRLHHAIIRASVWKSLRHWLQCSRLFHTEALIMAWCNLKISNQWVNNWICLTTRTIISKTVLMTVLTFMAIAKTNNRQELLVPEAAPTLWSQMSSMKVPRCFHRVFQNHHKFYCKELKEISTLMKTNKTCPSEFNHWTK
jgi:hypothetical protein